MLALIPLTGVTYAVSGEGRTDASTPAYRPLPLAFLYIAFRFSLDRVTVLVELVAEFLRAF